MSEAMHAADTAHTTNTTRTTRTTHNTDVLIVGAGPTGLALAVDLARRGVGALVVERATALFPGSRGKGMQPRTLEVLHDLGVLDAVRAAGGPAPVGMVWSDGSRQGEHRMFDVSEPTEAEPHQGPWLIPQWRTQEILLSRLRELGGEITLDRELTGLTQDADGVTASFTTGPEVRAHYAVAADGGRSTVRRLLGIGMTGETVDPRPTLVADIRVPALDRDNWHLFPPTGDHGFMAVCPLPGTEDFQLAADFPDPDTVVDLSPDGIREVVAARSHLAPEDVTEVRWASDFRPRAALADRFREGRVFLAGDAAHVHRPPGARASTPASRTRTTWAGSWAGCCAATRTTRCWTRTRRSGARWPRPCSASPPGSTGARNAGAGPHNSWASATGTPPSPSTPARTCPRTPSTPSDRAPDGRRGGVRLLDVFRGPHWTLLTVGTDAPTDLPDMSDLPQLKNVRTAHIPPYEAYGTGVFLVRPDGYVGWAGDTPVGLTAYTTAAGLS